MPSIPLPDRQTFRLGKGRDSLPGNRYFVTVCTHKRHPLFLRQESHLLGAKILHEMDQSGDLSLFCATFMPDHVHLLFELGKTLSLQRVISKFKSNVKREYPDDHIEWQRNFYDHQLRMEGSLESFAFYTFMNPYKNGLLKLDDFWGGWICSESFRPEFLSKLKDGKFPQPQWLIGLDVHKVIDEDL